MNVYTLNFIKINTIYNYEMIYIYIYIHIRIHILIIKMQMFPIGRIDRGRNIKITD